MKLNPPEDINRKIKTMRESEKVSHFNNIFTTIVRDQGGRIDDDDLRHITYSVIDFMHYYPEWTLNDLVVAVEFGKLGKWGNKESSRTKVCFANVQIWVRKYHESLQAKAIEESQQEAQERRKATANTVIDGSCEWGAAVAWRMKMLMCGALTASDKERITLEDTVNAMKEGREMELIPPDRRRYLTGRSIAPQKEYNFTRLRDVM